MITFDSVRAIGLSPARDFENNDISQLRTHKAFNYMYLSLFFFCFFIIIIGKIEGIRTLDDFCEMIASALSPYPFMVILGFLIQAIQCLDISNQREKYKKRDISNQCEKQNGPGRPRLPRASAGETVLNSKTCEDSLDELILTLGTDLSSPTGGYVLDSLYNLRTEEGLFIFLSKEYEKTSLAEWLLDRYKSNFNDIKPKSMTTLTQYDKRQSEKILKKLKKIYQEKNQ